MQIGRIGIRQQRCLKPESTVQADIARDIRRSDVAVRDDVSGVRYGLG
jgi:hypothetical protein